MRALNLVTNIVVAILGIILGIAVIGVTGYWAVNGIIAFFNEGMFAICDAIAGLCWLTIELVVIVKFIINTIRRW